jgi:wobble nucleotide-excising tRNase
VKLGLQYISDDKYPQACPFCQQETITKNIIDSIRQVFDEAYEQDVKQIESIKTRYEALTSSLSLQNISSSPLASKELVEAWSQEDHKFKISSFIKQTRSSPSCLISLALITWNVVPMTPMTPMRRYRCGSQLRSDWRIQKHQSHAN